jgi:hypothetical protein
MEGLRSPATERSRTWPWWLALLGLAAWQAWMTLSLFGPDEPWQRLCGDEPVVSGRHPLHLYHGHLGAQALRHTGHFCCYDPAFQAGYPKTPIFDSGSRPAELFLAAGGGTYRPEFYKLGLALTCVLVPALLVLACRGAGLGAAATCWATAMGLLVWWGVPGRQALEAGDIELLLAGLAVLAHVGLLLRYHQSPGAAPWLGLLLTGCVGWFAQPMVFLLLMPLLLVYYLTVGARHPSPLWHGALLTAQVGALAVNSYWLLDWGRHWWIRQPPPPNHDLLRHRTVQTIWEAPLWGHAADRDLSLLLLAGAAAGVVLLNQTQQRAAARLLGLGAVGLLALAVLGIAWPPLGSLGSSGLLVPALWFAALPAGHACASLGALVRRLPGRWRPVVWTAAAALAAAAALHPSAQALAGRCRGTTPLTIGLGPERAALVRVLVDGTAADARILWEDRPATPTTSRWTALLPLLADRPFLGGLDPDAEIEHTRAGLSDGKLAGKDIGKWTGPALAEYCRRYNVGWVVAWSPAVVERLRAWDGAHEVAQLKDDAAGVLFEVRRAPHNFALRGQAHLVHADSHHITLEDVVPENGVVLLSLHYQPGMRASPSRVRVEPETDPHDLVALVRLRVDGNVARVTLTWSDR